MTSTLATLLDKIAKDFEGEINPSAKHYCLVDLGKAAVVYELPELKDRYQGVRAVVPLRRTRGGVQVEVDGSDLINHVQLESGVAVEKYVAQEAGLSGTVYQPHKKMLLSMK